MEWIKEWLKKQREDALEEVGRYKGRAGAFEDVAELFDPDKRCQMCGSTFYSLESRGRHYKDHPDHAPVTNPPPDNL